DGTIKTDDWIDVSKDCYIGDYVIRPILNTTFGIIEYIYKVDYTKREATLINTFIGGDYTLKNNFDNNDKVIGDFVVNNKGSEIEIKVTSIADNWIKPLYTFEISQIPDQINLYLIIGESVNYIGYANHVKPEDFDETNIDTEKDYINYHLFSLKTIPGDEVDCKLTESGIPEMGVISTIATIYYYSEEQPTDAEGNYWHYDTDGKTPVVWEVTTGE
ncbi:MAG: hypothetical protein IJ415_03680, partial [Clostridia bacterium]|nr:hypothetical protein [Clostridia bacterium]